MPDTIRTLDAILTTLFQDGQPAGSISEQDMRDLIISVFGDYTKRGGVAGWRDLIGNLTTAKSGAGLNTPDFIKFRDDGAGSTGAYAYAFDDSTVESLFVSFHLDHDYKIGTAFYPHVHWSPGNSTNTGVVRWGIEWTAQQGHQQGTGFTVTTFTYIEQAASGIPYEHHVAEVPDPGITIAGAEPDMMILCRIFRDASHVNDTFTDDAFGFTIDGHYQTDHHSTKNKSPDFDA